VKSPGEVGIDRTMLKWFFKKYSVRVRLNLLRIQIMVFCSVMPCSDMVGYLHFRGPCFLHLQGEDSEYGPMACSYEYSDATMGSIKAEIFFLLALQL